jgi:CTP synthase (UTP-ammonia lyase)
VTRIAIVGDFDPANETHRATTAAFGDAEWLATEQVTEERLREFRGIVVAPASPYRSMDGALEAIRRAREQDVPLVGT